MTILTVDVLLKKASRIKRGWMDDTEAYIRSHDIFRLMGMWFSKKPDGTVECLGSNPELSGTEMRGPK